ncbi:MAG: neutral zinc metallopeptidase [Gammaproteobacteria bacterium]
MRWRQGRRSSNVEDRRGRGPIGRMSKGAKLGGGMTLIIILIGLFLGQDPMALLQMLNGSGGVSAPTQTTSTAPSANDEEADFISVVLADTEDVWKQIFAASGEQYRPPTLVLFTDVVQSACGTNSAATGPFYCPPDQNVYIDLGFFQELARLGAPGDFARAYVLGHEIGHHIQNLLGTEAQVRQARSRASQAQANALSVRLELQADCYAGVWAHHAHQQRQVLEQGDIEEGLTAASAIGDDRLQRQAGRRVNPDSFTHGSSAQRVEWFKRGLQTGSVRECNTFANANG